MASKKLFREYIGANWKGVSFSDVPINPNVEFHFILSFAVDYKTSTNYSPDNGNFIAYWDTKNLSHDAIAAVKEKHSNVKFAHSIGGNNLGDSENKVYFKADDKDSWVSNVVPSLIKIIQEYHLDGIDIDYEHFRTKTPHTFAECMGRLITTLKDNGDIKFASIAPYGDTSAYYQPLWDQYKDHIDYVNYQFYELKRGENDVDRYLDVYNTQSDTFDPRKLLASLSTEINCPGEDPIIAPYTAITAYATLKAEGRLNGIFIWSADDSKAGGFVYEKKAQDLLAKAHT